MKWIRLLTLLVIFALAQKAFSEELAIKEPRWKQLSQAHGFVLGQQASLELIEKKFPDLAKDVQEAWFSFNSTALGESVKGVEEELSRKFGEKWPKYIKAMTAQMDSLVGGQELTHQQAVAFLHEVRQRAKGDMPESILATLLSANPRFSKNPEFEMSNGWKQTFRTKGHPKAKGVDFSISFPASWSRREGYRPNIIQVFESSAGHGPISCNLMVKTLPLPAGYKITKEELKESFQPNELKGMIPDGSTFIDAKEIVLEGLPAGMLISDQTVERLELRVTMRMTQFVTIYDNSMIFIQFMVAKIPDSTDTLDDLQKQFLPTFKAVANTFVLNDLYKLKSEGIEKTSSIVAPSSENSENQKTSFMAVLYGEQWGWVLLISFLLKWGVGLTPSLLIRFVFMRRPIAKGWAFGAAFLFCIFNLVLFAAVNEIVGTQSTKTHSGLALVTIVSYLILRKGAKKQAETAS